MAVDKHVHAQEGFPTRCIFCPSEAPLTEEDWWPMWLRRYVPIPFDKVSHVSTRAQSPDFEHQHLGVFSPTWKNRGPIFSPLKVVCGNCNNTWMSRIQKRASVYLKPLLTGKWTDFTDDSQLAVSAWITMMSMVYDFYDMGTQSITQEERDYFMKNETPPRGWIVSMGFLRNDTVRKIWKRSSLIYSETLMPNEKPNLQTTTLAVGKLVLHSYSCSYPPPGVSPLDIKRKIGLEVIWPPLERPVSKPYRKVSNFAGVHFVAIGVTDLIRETRV